MARQFVPWSIPTAKLGVLSSLSRIPAVLSWQLVPLATRSNYELLTNSINTGRQIGAEASAPASLCVCIAVYERSLGCRPALLLHLRTPQWPMVWRLAVSHTAAMLRQPALQRSRPQRANLQRFM